MSSSSSKASCASDPAPKITYDGNKRIITTNRGTLIFAPMKSPSTNVKVKSPSTNVKVKDSKPIICPNNPYGMYNSEDEDYFPEDNVFF